jgi:hypothetical protein
MHVMATTNWWDGSLGLLDAAAGDSLGMARHDQM